MFFFWRSLVFFCLSASRANNDGRNRNRRRGPPNTLYTFMKVPVTLIAFCRRRRWYYAITVPQNNKPGEIFFYMSDISWVPLVIGKFSSFFVRPLPFVDVIGINEKSTRLDCSGVKRIVWKITYKSVKSTKRYIRSPAASLARFSMKFPVCDFWTFSRIGNRRPCLLVPASLLGKTILPGCDLRPCCLPTVWPLKHDVYV